MTAPGLSLHLRVTPLLGTARHLQDVHGLAPEDIDADDPHGLSHDHVVLHGGSVDAEGRTRLPRSAGAQLVDAVVLQDRDAAS